MACAVLSVASVLTPTTWPNASSAQHDPGRGDSVILTICVAGILRLDRMAHLDQPLRPGARLCCVRQVTRVGGGAANTDLGALGGEDADAEQLSTISSDLLFDRARRAGLDCSSVERVDGATRHATSSCSPTANAP